MVVEGFISPKVEPWTVSFRSAIQQLMPTANFRNRRMPLIGIRFSHFSRNGFRLLAVKAIEDEIRQRLLRTGVKAMQVVFSKVVSLHGGAGMLGREARETTARSAPRHGGNKGLALNATVQRLWLGPLRSAAACYFGNLLWLCNPV